MRRTLDIALLASLSWLPQLHVPESDADRSAARLRGILQERRQDAHTLARWADDGGREL